MKKGILGIVFLVFISSASVLAISRQKVKIGIKAGTSIPSLRDNSGNEISQGYESKMAESFGLIADFIVSERFSIKTGLDYSGQGGIRNGQQPVTNLPAQFSQILPPGTYLYANFNNNSVLNYMEVPLMGKFEWGYKWKYYLNAGPYIGYLLSAKQKTSGSSPFYLDKTGTMPLTIPGQPLGAQSFDATTDVKKDINTINIGLTGGVGLSFDLNKKSALVFDLRAAYGIKSVQKDTETNGNSKTGGIFLTLGYLFTMK
jgi:hypothetical protein